jgi:hypothetical protein
MFREKLGAIISSRFEQHEVKHFQEDTKTSTSFTFIFSALKVSLYF